MAKKFGRSMYGFVEDTIREYNEEGRLTIGRNYNHKHVRGPRLAVAIGLSEVWDQGARFSFRKPMDDDEEAKNPPPKKIKW